MFGSSLHSNQTHLKQSIVGHHGRFVTRPQVVTTSSPRLARWTFHFLTYLSSIRSSIHCSNALVRKLSPVTSSAAVSSGTLSPVIVIDISIPLAFMSHVLRSSVFNATDVFYHHQQQQQQPLVSRLFLFTTKPLNGLKYITHLFSQIRRLLEFTFLQELNSLNMF